MCVCVCMGLLSWLSGKESSYNAEDAGLIPRSGRCPRVGNSNLLQYFSWKIPWTEEPGWLPFMGSQRIKHD